MYRTSDREVEVAVGTVPVLKPFEETTVELTCGKLFEAGISYDLKVVINPDAQHAVILEGKATPAHVASDK